MRFKAIASPAVLGLILGVSTVAAHAQDAANGKKLFDTKCAICHNADSTEKKIGPGLKGLYSHATLADGTTRVTDETVTERILNGKMPMPPFKDQLTPAEVKDLVAYLKTL